MKCTQYELQYMDKQPSRRRGNDIFSKSSKADINFQSRSKKLRFVLWGLHEGAKSPLKVRRERFSIRPSSLCKTDNFININNDVVLFFNLFINDLRDLPTLPIMRKKPLFSRMSGQLWDLPQLVKTVQSNV